MSISDDEEDKKLGALASGVATSSSEDEGDKELKSTPTLAERHNALKAAAASCSTGGARAQPTASTTSARGGATASCIQLFGTSDPREEAATETSTATLLRRHEIISLLSSDEEDGPAESTQSPEPAPVPRTTEYGRFDDNQLKQLESVLMHLPLSFNTLINWHSDVAPHFSNQTAANLETQFYKMVRQGVPWAVEVNARVTPPAVAKEENASIGPVTNTSPDPSLPPPATPNHTTTVVPTSFPEALDSGPASEPKSNTASEDKSEEPASQHQLQNLDGRATASASQSESESSEDESAGKTMAEKLADLERNPPELQKLEQLEAACALPEAGASTSSSVQSQPSLPTTAPPPSSSADAATTPPTELAAAASAAQQMERNAVPTLPPSASTEAAATPPPEAPVGWMAGRWLPPSAMEEEEEEEEEEESDEEESENDELEGQDARASKDKNKEPGSQRPTPLRLLLDGRSTTSASQSESESSEDESAGKTMKEKLAELERNPPKLQKLEQLEAARALPEAGASTTSTVQSQPFLPKTAPPPSSSNEAATTPPTELAAAGSAAQQMQSNADVCKDSDSESDSSEDESAGKTMKDKLQGLTESSRRKLEQLEASRLFGPLPLPPAKPPAVPAVPAAPVAPSPPPPSPPTAATPPTALSSLVAPETLEGTAAHAAAAAAAAVPPPQLASAANSPAVPAASPIVKEAPPCTPQSAKTAVEVTAAENPKEECPNDTSKHDTVEAAAPMAAMAPERGSEGASEKAAAEAAKAEMITAHTTNACEDVPMSEGEEQREVAEATSVQAPSIGEGDARLVQETAQAKLHADLDKSLAYIRTQLQGTPAEDAVKGDSDRSVAEGGGGGRSDGTAQPASPSRPTVVTAKVSPKLKEYLTELNQTELLNQIELLRNSNPKGLKTLKVDLMKFVKRQLYKLPAKQGIVMCNARHAALLGQEMFNMLNLSRAIDRLMRTEEQSARLPPSPLHKREREGITVLSETEASVLPQDPRVPPQDPRPKRHRTDSAVVPREAAGSTQPTPHAANQLPELTAAAPSPPAFMPPAVPHTLVNPPHPLLPSNADTAERFLQELEAEMVAEPVLPAKEAGAELAACTFHNIRQVYLEGAVLRKYESLLAKLETVRSLADAYMPALLGALRHCFVRLLTRPPLDKVGKPRDPMYVLYQVMSVRRAQTPNLRLELHMASLGGRDAPPVAFVRHCSNGDEDQLREEWRLLNWMIEKNHWARQRSEHEQGTALPRLNHAELTRAQRGNAMIRNMVMDQELVHMASNLRDPELSRKATERVEKYCKLLEDTIPINSIQCAWKYKKALSKLNFYQESAGVREAGAHEDRAKREEREPRAT